MKTSKHGVIGTRPGYAAVAIWMWTAQLCAAGPPIAGFTMPSKSIDVASAETGVVTQLRVQEGQLVQRGQPVAQLDDELYVAQVNTAKRNTELRGKLAAAQAELALRQERLQKLIALLNRGSARPEEVDRARTDLAIAHGHLLDIQEQLELRRLEYERSVLQLKRRTINAPLTGIVTQLYKHAGEFVGPNDPNVIHIDQLDPLLAVFSVPASVAHRLTVGTTAKVQFPRRVKTVTGTIKFVAPIIDGKSGTVRVKVTLNNDAGDYFAGQSCSLVMDAANEETVTKK